MPNAQPLATVEAAVRAPAEVLRRGLNRVNLSLGLGSLPEPQRIFGQAPMPAVVEMLVGGRTFARRNGLRQGLPYTAGVESGDRPATGDTRFIGVVGDF